MLYEIIYFASWISFIVGIYAFLTAKRRTRNNYNLIYGFSQAFCIFFLALLIISYLDGKEKYYPGSDIQRNITGAWYYFKYEIFSVAYLIPFIFSGLIAAFGKFFGKGNFLKYWRAS